MTSLLYDNMTTYLIHSVGMCCVLLVGDLNGRTGALNDLHEDPDAE